MKNIVICFDGTGNFITDNPTNVSKLVQLSVYNQNQLTYYDAGVGTFSIFSIKSFASVLIYLFGGAFGWGIVENILDAYSYLMSVYENGDNIYIFGFSRGAYTARSLCGLLHKIGLLEKGNEGLLPYVQSLYYGKNNDKEVRAFRNGVTQVCTPHFLGLWDTVDSRGVLTERFFHMDTTLHPDIRFAYQALAIDEKRSHFQPLLLDEPLGPKNQEVEQVWFSGCHCDVGGFYDDCGLSDIALDWMLKKAEAVGLILKDDWQTQIKPNPLAPIHESYTGWWKLLGKKVRNVPENSRIHTSVFNRMRDDHTPYGYNPINLPKNYTEVSP